ncbi:hypothetical protein PGB90_006580 [Kerria lacca]
MSMLDQNRDNRIRVHGSNCKFCTPLQNVQVFRHQSGIRIFSIYHRHLFIVNTTSGGYALRIGNNFTFNTRRRIRFNVAGNVRFSSFARLQVRGAAEQSSTLSAFDDKMHYRIPAYAGAMANIVDIAPNFAEYCKPMYFKPEERSSNNTVNSVLFAFAKKESTSTSSKSADSVKAVNNPSTKHSEPIIEDVTAKQLEKILNEKDYVAVFWYTRSCHTCDAVLNELENIDDDTDSFGVDFVKINDKRLAKHYGIKNFPALTYFREKEPIIYEGDLMDEENVLNFLTSLEALDLPDRIEEVNSKILQKIIEDTEFVAVLFYKQNCRKCAKVLQELENIDDEADQLGIGFVKISDDNLAEEYNLGELPKLVYYRHQIPIVYENDNDDKESQIVLNELEKIDDDCDRHGIQFVKIDDPKAAKEFDDNNDRKSLRVLNELENIDDECDKLGVTFVKIDNSDEAKEYGIDKLPALVYFEKGIPLMYKDDKNQKKSQKILAELENIDDECDQNDIAFVKIDDVKEAQEYGILSLPQLIFFEKKIPHIYEGDLTKEEELLSWLIHQKRHNEIPEVTNKIVDKLIDSVPYLAVLFYDKDDKQDIRILNELENIDDELEKEGIVIVRIDNDDEAKEYGIDHLPTLIYFENKIPALYEGGRCEEGEKCDQILSGFENIDDELDESGIVFVTTEDQNIAKEYNIKNFPALVFFRNKEPLYYSDREGDKKSQKILAELENIDDECEEKGISFVKTSDEGIDKEYDLPDLPAVVYYRNRFRKIYNGDLMHEEAILAWVLELYVSTPDIIESVDRKTLQVLIQDVDHLAVFFYNEKCESCESILNDLETIDDDTDKYGIQFVKSKDSKLASELGIFSFPALVYYETGVPIMYDGDSCFYIGLSGKEHASVPSFEPYQCCRAGEKKYSSNNNNHEDGRYSSKKEKTAVSADNKIKNKVETKPTTPDKEKPLKGKKNANGNGKYIWWWFYQNDGFEAFENKYHGNMLDESEVLEWMMKQKTDESVEDINREQLFEYMDTKEFLAVVWYIENDLSMIRVIRHIELIDDEALEYGIKIVKCKDKLMAKKFGFRNPPGLTYFRRGKFINYDGDIEDDEELLDWLTDPTNMEMTDHIERVNRKMFEKIRQTSDYVAVFFYSDDCKQCNRVLAELEHIDDDADNVGIDFVKINDKKFAKEVGVFALPAVVFFKLGSKEPVIYADKLDECAQCTRILEELENIDDDCDRHGITFVKTQDHSLAENFGVQDLPSLVYFENQIPNVFAGDLEEEEEVLQWLITQKTEDRIELITRAMLEAMVEDTQYLAVYFCDLQNEESVLEWLIDDDNRELADEIEEVNSRMLERLLDESLFLAVFFCDLYDEDKILTWLTSQDVFEIKNEIEEVNRKMLAKLLDENEFLAVYFYEKNSPVSMKVLDRLERIDGETDEMDVTFVKMGDPRYARKWGVTKLPAIVYFRNRFPSIYRGDCESEVEVLEWLRKNRYRQPELNVFMYALLALTLAFICYTAFLLYGFPHLPRTT